MVTVNVVVLAGSVAADPVVRRMPSGDEVAHISCGCHDARGASVTTKVRDLRPSFRGSAG
jgi:single-stranded DNA-binding protein